MEKNVGYLLVVIAVAFLLIGGLVGYNMAPTKVVTETVTQIEYQNVSVETIVEVAAPNQLELAVAEFMQAVEDEEDEAGNPVDVIGSYDFDEIEVSKVYEGWSVDYTNDETTVDFRIKLRFDEDGEPSEKETFDVTVFWEDSEDTIVEVA